MQARDPTIGMIVYGGVLWDVARDHPKQPALFDELIFFIMTNWRKSSPRLKALGPGSNIIGQFCHNRFKLLIDINHKSRLIHM